MYLLIEDRIPESRPIVTSKSVTRLQLHAARDAELRGYGKIGPWLCPADREEWHGRAPDQSVGMYRILAVPAI